LSYVALQRDYDSQEDEAEREGEVT
jgi:hypothetical protein